MNILLVCKSLPDTYKGGIQTHVWHLSRELIALGNQVTILTAGSYKKGTCEEKKEGRTLIKLAYLPLRKLPYLTTLADEWAFNKAAAKWLRKNEQQFDIVHLQGRSGNLYLKNKPQHCKPVVVTMHGFLSEEYGSETRNKPMNWASNLHLRYGSALELYALKNADALVPVSYFSSSICVQKYPHAIGKIAIINNGIEISARPKIVQFKTTKLVFVGSLTHRKGVFELVETMLQVHDSVSLTIIGDGPERANLQAFVKKLGLEDRILLLGAQNESVVYTHIDEAFALILPSFSETQGIVLMEANVRCKPVIASDIPGINEVVEHNKNGILFQVGNKTAMAHAINTLAGDAKMARTMGQTGREMMEKNYAWTSIAQETLALYQQLTTPKETTSDQSRLVNQLL